MQKYILSIIIIFLSLFSFPVFAQLAETPWPVFRQNNQHTGQSFYNGPKSFELAWKFPTKDIIESSPAIDYDGTIYMGSNNGHLYAVNPNGTQKWRFETNGSIQSSPAINEDGTIYVGSGDNIFYAINPDGTLKWKYDSEFYIYSSPAIGADGTIYFITSYY